MWVTIIAFQPDPPEYLGILINSPDLIGTVKQFDNVAFTVHDPVHYPLAVAIDGNFRQGGLPPLAPPAFRDAMADGLNEYRQGAFGHNPPGIEAAITHFSRAKDLITEATGDGARFNLHFFLGRCYAEKYETLKAIDEFQQAVGYRPDDVDAQLALLAEYSWLAHAAPDRLPAGEPELWAQRFEAGGSHEKPLPPRCALQQDD